MNRWPTAIPMIKRNSTSRQPMRPYWLTSALDVVQEDERLTAGHHRVEGFVNGGVERGAHQIAYPLDRLLRRHLLLVRPGGRERVEDLDRTDDARPERDGLAGQPVGVAEPVPALVVTPDQGDDLVQVDRRR